MVMRVAAGDLVVLFGGHEQIHLVLLETGGVFNCQYGSFKHDEIVGLEWGSRIIDKRKRKWFAVLRPTPEFVTLALRHRTQILYLADISLVTMFLDARDGKLLVESGTGSGSMTTSLARAVGPTGHVHTFEFHAGRHAECQEEFSRYGVSQWITCHLRDVYAKGFLGPLTAGSADGIFLDLPQPWEALGHADEVLRAGGRIVSFSPCIEQVARATAWLTDHGYLDVTTVECLIKGWNAWVHSGESNKREPKPPMIKVTKAPLEFPHCATVNAGKFYGSTIMQLVLSACLCRRCCSTSCL